MFSTFERLKKRTPSGGISREEFIAHLVEEFHTTTNIEAQEQVSANLANFAYDPINYEFLKNSTALNVFLECIESLNDRLQVHGISGICNICLDPYFQNILISPKNLQNIFKLLYRNNPEIVITTITTLYFLIVDEKTKDLICKSSDIEKIRKLTESTNIRIQKIAIVFCEDFKILESNSNNSIKTTGSTGAIASTSTHP